MLNNTSKIADKQENNKAEKNKLQVVCYCRVGSAEQLSGEAEIAKAMMQKGGESHHAIP